MLLRKESFEDKSCVICFKFFMGSNNEGILPAKRVIEKPHRKLIKRHQKAKNNFVVGCIKKKDIFQ